MGDNTGIEWTDATLVSITEASGRVRTRVYHRKRTDRPGTQERRRQRALGFAWCRGCEKWLQIADVARQGACQPCLNAEYRERYALDGEAIRRRVYARKRSIEPMPIVGGEYLIEQFEGVCAYCPDPSSTWDHIIPVAAGGQTVPGNIVPACGSCNSSKCDSEVFEWLVRTGRTPHFALLDVLLLHEVAA